MVFLLACVVYSLSTFNQFTVCDELQWQIQDFLEREQQPQREGCQPIITDDLFKFSFEDTPTSPDIWWPKLTRLASGLYASYWDALELMCFQFRYLDLTIKDICNINSE